ncbi:MAG TPA: PASTA domain-containing protein [Bacteroidia bacterium]|nr:PASTA domain-containing protein [Bacteroidia bacterium]
MSVIDFIKSKTFFKQLALAIVLISLLLWGVLKMLAIYTLHGQSIAVPNFSGLKTSEINHFIKGKNLNYKIIDSVYDAKSPKGVVIRQEPENGDHVKKGRTIYLSVTSILPPQIEMPKLTDQSLRQAASMIETYGLKLGKIRYVPDICANCILKQLNNGKDIEPGTEIAKGSVIDLVVGKGLSDVQVAIPNLIGMTRQEALSQLAKSSLNEGAISFDTPADSAKAKIYMQKPSYSGSATLNMGSSIDIFLTNDNGKIPVIKRDTSNTAKN